MIINHKYRFIAVKTVKTAGTSLEIVLSKYSGPRDVVSRIAPPDEKMRSELGYRGPQNTGVPWRGLSRHERTGLLLRGERRTFGPHTPAHAIQASYPQLWEDYTSFAMIRNPFERIVSMYFFTMKGRFDVSFREWLLENPGLLNTNRKITFVDGMPGVDFFIRFEDLERGLAELSKRTGLPPSLYHEMTAVRAKSSTRPPGTSVQEMFASFPEGIDLVASACATEIALFGYEVPRPGGSTS